MQWRSCFLGRKVHSDAYIATTATILHDQRWGDNLGVLNLHYLYIIAASLFNKLSFCPVVLTVSSVAELGTVVVFECFIFLLNKDESRH